MRAAGQVDGGRAARAFGTACFPGPTTLQWRYHPEETVA